MFSDPKQPTPFGWIIILWKTSWSRSSFRAERVNKLDVNAGGLASWGWVKRMEPAMLASTDFALLQREQHHHDMRNHSDIACLHKTERMKHYGLHYAKYVGRLARETAEPKSVERTLVDALLVNLSAANTLQQDLSREDVSAANRLTQLDPLRVFADAAGRFADACEKIDHMEDFVSMARTANRDIASWLVCAAKDRHFDLLSGVRERRKELAARHFYIAD